LVGYAEPCGFHFVRNDVQTAAASRHCEERSDEATQRKIQNSKLMNNKRMDCFTLRVRNDGLLRAGALVMTGFLSSFVLIQKKQKIKSGRRYTVARIVDCDRRERRPLDVLIGFVQVDCK
jgi:hypothetical protein